MTAGPPLPPPVTAPMLAEAFDAARITTLRHGVRRCAAAAGLVGRMLDDFVLAVNELATNAVRHGGGRGHLRLWHTDDEVVCEVADHGPGIPTGRGDGQRPDPRSAGGWGLWLARQLSAAMTVHTGPAGTTVRVSAPVTPARR